MQGWDGENKEDEKMETLKERRLGERCRDKRWDQMERKGKKYGHEKREKRKQKVCNRKHEKK